MNSTVDARRHRHRPIEPDGLQLRQRAERVALGVERQRRARASSSRGGSPRARPLPGGAPASGSTSRHRSAVPGVQNTRPRNPCATSRGR